MEKSIAVICPHCEREFKRKNTLITHSPKCLKKKTNKEEAKAEKSAKLEAKKESELKEFQAMALMVFNQYKRPPRICKGKKKYRVRSYLGSSAYQDSWGFSEEIAKEICASLRKDYLNNVMKWLRGDGKLAKGFRDFLRDNLRCRGFYE